MADIIQLLPDSIANQIAAGEVIQRPASVVKELLENSIDASATFVQLIIKDAGKTLVQVIDDGKGMSETDARMSLERHATSKIRKADDLFAITTMGFRGEALASIASIAQVQLITRPAESEMGVKLEISATKIKSQDYCQAPKGTSISVKNLFFNVPARRKFLKSDPVELKHVLEEFKRISLANPRVRFSLKHNGNEIYHLNEDNLRKRIVNIFGKNVNEHLVPIQETTDVLAIEGFIGKPFLAKKNKGDQYLFVNNRFIRSSYLNHAIKVAYSALIGDDQVPFYVLFLTLDPARIDINVHPTKTEIKFEEERLIYQYLKVSVQHGLGKYNVTPSIDFETENNILGHRPAGIPQVYQQNSPDRPTKAEKDSWLEFYNDLSPAHQTLPSDQNSVLRLQSDGGSDLPFGAEPTVQVEKLAYQLHNTYVINQIKSGYLIIHQQHAHERILYEKLLSMLEKEEKVTQQLLFPITFDLNPDETILLEKLLPAIGKLGFNMDTFGQNSFIINGVPAILKNDNVHAFILDLVQKSAEDLDFNAGLVETVAAKLAKHSCIKKNVNLSSDEMTRLIDDLFACEVPFVSPSGKKCFVDISLSELEKLF